jgi:hypothetical protein
MAGATGINAGAWRPEENEDDRVVDCEHLETCLSTRRTSMASSTHARRRRSSDIELEVGHARRGVETATAVCSVDVGYVADLALRLRDPA